MVNQSDDSADDKTDSNTEMPLEQRSRALFDAQVANQNAHIRSRLNQARQAALEVKRGVARPAFSGWLWPMGSVAVLALAVVIVQFMRPLDQQVMTVTENVDDVEILTADTDLDMLQNIDFYAWAATQPENSGTAATTGEAG